MRPPAPKPGFGLQGCFGGQATHLKYSPRSRLGQPIGGGQGRAKPPPPRQPPFLPMCRTAASGKGGGRLGLCGRVSPPPPLSRRAVQLAGLPSAIWCPQSAHRFSSTLWVGTVRTDKSPAERQVPRLPEAGRGMKTCSPFFILSCSGLKRSAVLKTRRALPPFGCRRRRGGRPEQRCLGRAGRPAPDPVLLGGASPRQGHIRTLPAPPPCAPRTAPAAHHFMASLLALALGSPWLTLPPPKAGLWPHLEGPGRRHWKGGLKSSESPVRSRKGHLVAAALPSAGARKALRPSVGEACDPLGLPAQ